MRQETFSTHLTRLIAVNAPLWAGEAEVFRTYWDSPARTRATDQQWLLRQAFKEYWDGFVPALRIVNDTAGQSGAADSRARLQRAAWTAAEEYDHFCRFADAFAGVGGDVALLEPDTLRAAGDWPGNVALMALRREHRARHGALGERAYRLTEGGYCTLYREGQALLGRGAGDDLIARACMAVYEDEFDHMLLGIIGLDAQDIADADWELLATLSAEQMRARIAMRNEQFGFPVAPERLAELRAGLAPPLAFDYQRAITARRPGLSLTGLAA